MPVNVVSTSLDVNATLGFIKEKIFTAFPNLVQPS